MNILTELWQQRWLFLTFVRREVTSRYSGTIAGGLWALGQPVLLLMIYGFVFRKVFKVGFPELGEHSFVAFVACALWPWMAFQEGVQRATHAVVGNSGLVKKVHFPHELLVFASVGATFFIHFLGFLVVICALMLGGEPFQLAGLPVVLMGWLAILLLASAIALVTSSFQVFLKDIDHMLGPALMIMFYVTPILYPTTQVPESVRWIVGFNPLVHLLEPIRAGLMQGDVSAIGRLMVFVAGGMAAVFAAVLLFRRLSDYFEDFI